MDHLRVLLVPFHSTSLVLIAVFATLQSFFDSAGMYGLLGLMILQIWVVKYCYALIEQIADGATEPPVLSLEMLSPTEIRPWIQVGLVALGVLVCDALGGKAGIALAVVLLTLLPATIAVLGVGEPFHQALNPLLLFRLIRGLGVYYLAILASIPLYLGLLSLLTRLGVWSFVWFAAALVCEISFFSLIGGALFLRRRKLGIVPSRSPERTEARAETEREKVRSRMLDDVFQQVRIGKHVEASRPLAQWLRDLDGETAARDARHIVGQILGWGSSGGINTLGSTLIRHLLRAGRPDAALSTFERLRQHAPALTLDSADDLRALAEYADSIGRDELATSLRLETPIHRP
jgi:hypothetical protein